CLFQPLRSDFMLYVILFAVFVATGIAFYFLIQPLRDFLQRSVFRQKDRVARELEEMFILISVENLQTIKSIVALTLAGIALVLTWEAKRLFPFLVGAVCGVAGYWAPEIVIIVMRRKRRERFSEQLVDGMVLMGNGLRAGFTLLQAIDMLVEEMPAPIS